NSMVYVLASDWSWISIAFCMSSLVPEVVGFHEPVQTQQLSGAPPRESIDTNLLCMRPAPLLIASKRSLISGMPAPEIELNVLFRLSYSQITRTFTPRFLAAIIALTSAVPGVPFRL